MGDFFANGHAINLLILLLLVELAVVKGLRQRAPLVTSMLAGLGLLVAWRLAHSGAGWMWVSLALMASGAAHGWDLWQRWPRRPAA